MLFGAIPIVYEENRGWSPVAGTLPFLSVLTGCFIAAGEYLDLIGCIVDTDRIV